MPYLGHRPSSDDETGMATIAQPESDSEIWQQQQFEADNNTLNTDVLGLLQSFSYLLIN
jgi:hypothetical protein